jgi:hypothetical protein
LTIKYDEEHPPVARKVVCIDFDATIFPWGELNSEEPPLQDAIETIRAFKDAGYRIVIFTSRMSPTWWRAEGWANDFMTHHKWWSSVAERLIQYDIPFDSITSEKVPAEYYIDDKAIRFENNWAEIQLRVLG